MARRSSTGAETTPEQARLLLEASSAFSNAFQRRLASIGSDGRSYPELLVMETLHCAGPAKMRSLADQVRLSPRQMTALADRLEDDGMIRRVAHPTDRRATLLELTDDGYEVAKESLAPRLDEVSRVFDSLSAAQREQLLELLGTLAAELNMTPGDIA